MHLTLLTGFLHQASLRPRAVAVRAGHDSLSYAELDEHSARVASALRARGLGTGDVVGVCLPRTPALLVGLLGVLRSGSAYLPLDPQDPPRRRSQLLDDAGAPAVVAAGEAMGEHPRSLHIDDLTAQAGAEDLAAPGPGDLAYVIYTSGSTGRPKGVAVPHSCVVALFEAMDGHIAGGPGDVWLSVTSATFDISVFELFWTLGRGLTVELANTSPDALFSTALARPDHDITHMQATPTLLSGLLLDAPTRAGMARLGTLVSTGEALPPQLARQLRDLVGATLLNAYGPTETTVWATVEQLVAPPEGPVSIGRPLAGQSVYVLDREGRPVPDGAIGELHIGGPGVSWGYLGRPGQTASAFVADPFTAQDGARMYRTGDLGHRLDDGRIVCLGRNDRQVKIRGHRIELDEVEHRLVELDDVATGAVIVEGDPATRRLTAVVCPAVTEPDPTAIRAELAATLTPAAVPSTVRFVDDLPRTTSGKVDRASLGDRTPSPADDSATYEVVVNSRGQHALWWATQPRPAGWEPTGVVGTRSHCAREAEHRWRHIRPLQA